MQETGEGAGEIDFIVDDSIAIEVKLTMSKRDVHTLKNRSKSLNIKENYVITHQFDKNETAILATDL